MAKKCEWGWPGDPALGGLDAQVRVARELTNNPNAPAMQRVRAVGFVGGVESVLGTPMAPPNKATAEAMIDSMTPRVRQAQRWADDRTLPAALREAAAGFVEGVGAAAYVVTGRQVATSGEPGPDASDPDGGLGGGGGS
jgi:hypothetical protein